MATRLYPPYIEGVIPAFSGTEISVPFSMNRAVSKNEVDGFGLKIKTISSNIQIAQVFKQIDKTEEFPNVIKFNISKELANNQFQIGTFYKVQLCYFSYEKDSNGKIIYDNNQTPNRILGYFSTVGVIKYTSNPEVSIIDLSSKNINMHKYDYAGEYKMTEDKSEKVYSYSFDLFDKNKRLVKTSGEMIHNNFNDAEYGISIDTFKIEEDLPMSEICFLQYTVKTINGLIKSSPLYRIAQKKSINPEIKAKLIANLNFENGYIDLRLIGDTDENGLEYPATGSFKVVRAENSNNYTAWNEVLRFVLNGQQPSSWLWKDLTIKQGVTYKYAIQQYNDTGLSSNRIESNPVYGDFEHAFLYDGERQLKIKYNPKVSSFKNDILESKMDTIGGKFPFIFRNGNVKYKEFPINGLISQRSDEEFLFSAMNKKNENLRGRINSVNFGDPTDKEHYHPGIATTWKNSDAELFGDEQRLDFTIDLTSKNIRRERDFKLEVLEWLNNGEPKLFRSPNEGNYIVRLLNVSMQPIDSTGRMIHTFSATAYEIVEYTHQNLVDTGLIYAENPMSEQIRWESIELDKSGEAKPNYNLLNYPALSLRIEGMIPGDKLRIVPDYIEDINDGYIITIGSTGSYNIDLSSGFVIKHVSFEDEVNKTKYVVHQGLLTYAYRSRVQNRFDAMSNISIQEEPLKQFIGEHNISKEINDVKTEIQDYYFVKGLLREVLPIYQKKFMFDRELTEEELIQETYFYKDKNFVNVISKEDLDVLCVYEIYQSLITESRKENFQVIGYYDPYNDTISSSFSPSIWFDENEFSLLDIGAILKIRPPMVKELKCGNGVILEAGFQLQKIDYEIEKIIDRPKYQALIDLEVQLLQAKDNLMNNLYGKTSIDYENSWEDAITIWEEEYKLNLNLYNALYKDYLILLEECLEKEEESQGDIIE